MENESGALSRVSGLFSARGYNIESLNVAPTEDETLSRMTIVTSGSNEVIEQIIKQLDKLIDVINVSDISKQNVVIRELALIKVTTESSNRTEILQLAETFRSSVVDVSPRSVIIEVTGDDNKVDSLMDILKPFGIIEVMRTGRVGLLRGDSA